MSDDEYGRPPRYVKQPPVTGTVVLIAGTITVASAAVTANSRIRLAVQAVGGTPGTLSYALNAGVGFTITSSSAADTSTIAYLIEPGT